MKRQLLSASTTRRTILPFLAAVAGADDAPAAAVVVVAGWGAATVGVAACGVTAATAVAAPPSASRNTSAPPLICNLANASLSAPVMGVAGGKSSVWRAAGTPTAASMAAFKSPNVPDTGTDTRVWPLDDRMVS